MMSEGRFLVVKAGGERYGLVLASVREVVDTVAPRPAPSHVAAVRGVMALHDRFFTLVHLGALLSGGKPPEAVSETAVVTELGAASVAFEVDDVEAVVDSGAIPVGAGGAGGVLEVWKVGEDLVSVLDLEVLAGRLAETGAHV